MEFPKRRPAVAAFALLLLVAADGARAGEADVAELIREFRGEGEPRRRSREEREAAYLKVIDSLVPRMGSDDYGTGGNERRTFQRMCWHAGRPGGEDERASLMRAAAQRIGPGTPLVARAWLIRQIERNGRDEVVVPLARLFEENQGKGDEGEDDAQVRECARRALENNPSRRATRALCGALYLANAPEWRAALLSALGSRADVASIGALARFAADDDDRVRGEAAKALASLGRKAARRLIADGLERGSERSKRVARDAYLLLADMLSREESATALQIYREFLDREGHLKCAAIVGLGRAGGVKELGTVMDVLDDEDAEVRGAGVIALEMMPLDKLREAVKENVKNAPPKRKAGLLRALAGRKDPGSLPIFAAAATDPDEAVRVVALAAMAKVGDASSVPLLARATATGSEEERETARRSLDRISDPAADRAILDLMRGLTRRAEAPMRAELVRSLAARGAVVAVPEIVKTAGDADAALRKQSFRALAALAGGDALPDLVRLLAGARGKSDSREAEKALVAACRRVEDVEQRARPVLSGLRKASSERKADAEQSLLRVLGKIGGRAALAAVRGKIEDTDPATAEAALRALADWPDAASAGDLLRLARSAPDEKRRILALRGYVRVVGLPSNRAADETLRMYGDGLRAARRPEDRRLVLAGMGEVKDPAALGALRPHLKNTDLADEAAAAMIKVALGLDRGHREEAKAALRAAIKACRAEKVRQEAVDALGKIEMYEDHIPTWLLAGPYSQKGKKGADLFETPFPPEEPMMLGAEDTKWRIASARADDDPWLVEIDRIIRGSNRACYLVAEVNSPAAQEALLELGSDDGVKVWLNGEAVHENNVNRGVSPGQDKVKVRLKKGWNSLMLKVTQGGGSWSACARFRRPDGSRLGGLRSRVDRRIYLGHIAQWQLAGPYTEKGKRGVDLFDVAFAPEKRSPIEKVEWRDVEAGTNPGRPYIVEMDRILGGDERACYLRAQVRSPRSQKARLEIGSDDGVKAWLNGRLVHANNAVRGINLAQDKADVVLKRGWNRLMLKIVQGGGQWSACARFRAPGGGEIKGLETRVEGW